MTIPPPPPDLLSTREEVAAILKRELDEAATGRVDFLLVSATRAFRTETRQHITQVLSDAAVLDSDGSACLLLPETPVTDVLSVTADSVTLEPDAYEWSASGILRKTDRWPDGFRRVLVTYDHGFEESPADVSYAVAEWVAVRMVQTPGTTQESVALGAFSQSASYAPGGVTETWSKTVQAYRRTW